MSSDREFKKRKLMTKTVETDKRRRDSQEKANRSNGRVILLFKDIRSLLDDLEKRVHNEISRKTEQESLSDVTPRMKDKLVKQVEEPDTGDLCDPEKESDEDTGGHDGGDHVMGLISHVSRTLPDIIRGVNVTFYGQGPADILLDVHTAANNIHISDDQKTATWTKGIKNHPKTAERFQYYPQVMSRSSITSGRHYWDVGVRKSEVWMVGVCYSSIDRRGRQSHIGGNNKSWGLYVHQLYEYKCLVLHDSKVIRLPHQISSNRFRIYVDYEAGQLSFYDLCDPIRHLHTFSTTFTEPLHAALWVWESSIMILGGPHRRD